MRDRERFQLLILLGVWINAVWVSGDISLRYAAIDQRTFEAFTPQWTELHSSWIGIDESAAASYCEDHDGKKSAVSYPLCVAGKIVKSSYPAFDQLLTAQQVDRQLLLGDESCPAAVCSVKSSSSVPDQEAAGGRIRTMCSYTPFDTIDYLPPPSDSSLDSTSICSYDGQDPMIPCNTLGMDEGIPPHFTPVHAIRLNISGRVMTMLNDQCFPVPNARIEAWQVNPTALTALTVEEQRFNRLDRAALREKVESSEIDDDEVIATLGSEATDAQTKFTSSSLPLNDSLRELSCRAKQHSLELTGEYHFNTLLPPSYGPPRHIMFQVSAPGYSTLTTRMYFDKDYRLQQLTTLGGEEVVRGFGSLPVALGFESDKGFEQSRFPGAIRRDPRVAELIFVETNSGERDASLVSGTFVTSFDFVLSPTREEEKRNGARIRPATNTASKTDDPDQQPLPPYDVSGLWADPSGGFVLIETIGPSFIAHQYPHPRTWGTALGVIVGNTIRNVNFRQVFSESDVNAARDLFDNPQIPLQPSSLVWTASGSTATGTIIPSNQFTTAMHDETSPAGLSIEWSISDGQSGAPSYLSLGMGRWTKVVPDAAKRSGTAEAFASGGYRFVKIVIQRQTGGFSDGRIIINEIELFEGVLSQTKRPLNGFEMQTPRTPPPQAVTCSSFLSQDFHCYKAFDGDSSSGSQWVTSGEKGNRRNKLMTSPYSGTGEWVTFDFGFKHGIKPTGLRIVCDAQNSESRQGPKGCPMTFSLMGSHDNKNFDIIHRVDLFDRELQEYATQRGDGSMLFSFPFETSAGRPLGQQCGSCTTGPIFACHLDAYDGTCDSRYCGSNGRCSSLPSCRLGEYLHFHVTQGSARPQYECKLCAAGRFGNSSNLIGPACSGICEAGYYCPVGSTSAQQYPCGDSSVFCPVGSGQPIIAGAGRYTVSDHNLTISSAGYATREELCEKGHYCTGGIQIPCPVGTYGDERGLRSPLCSAQGNEDADPGCIAGYYCPKGSITPTVCPHGYYCPDGRTPYICPAGTFGDSEGLKDKRCSGLCHPGFYCEAGSVNEKSKPCPAGTFGDVAGLTNSSCSGLCREGYYCPLSSVSDTQVPCGGSHYFCPAGSPEPVPVATGFYTVGGLSQETRTTQIIAERGFYATRGVRWPCRAGTYGGTLGLSADNITVPAIDFDIDSSTVNENQIFNGTSYPSVNPTVSPSMLPSEAPTQQPSMNLTQQPSSMPSSTPFAAIFSSLEPTFTPTTAELRPRTAFLCSGLCPAGHYCPVNSSSAEEFPCPAGRYGAVPGLTTDACTAICPLGHYCPVASTAPIKCPAGVFGNTTGLTDPSCSQQCWEGGCDENQNLCIAGYYCPAGSIQGNQVPCGGADKYCPRGSAWPTPVSDGHYTVGGPEENGAFRSSNAAHTRTAQRICEEGYYCESGVKRPCPPGVYGSSKGLTSALCTAPCPAGYYCPEASTNGTTHRCSQGRYGAEEGMHDSECSGECEAGFHCYEGSTSPTQLECGVLFLSKMAMNSTYLEDLRIRGISLTAFEEDALIPINITKEQVNVYLSDFNTTILILPNTQIVKHVATQSNKLFCPKGTGIPITVRPGYYTVGGNRTTRSAQLPCPMGTYCTDGELHLCPAGTYGRAERLQDSNCTGLCAKGYYCPEGSTIQTQRPCPVGYFGAVEGLQTSLCSGPCPHPLDCPEASTTPLPRSEF